MAGTKARPQGTGARVARPLPPGADDFLSTHTGADGSPKTWISYRTALGAFWEHRQKLSEPEGYAVDTLVRFFEFLDARGRASDTKRLYLLVVRKFLEYLETDGLLGDVKLADMQRRLRTKVGRKRLAKSRRHASPWVYLIAETAELEAQSSPPPTLSEERQRLWKLISFRDSAIVWTLLSTGTRVSEIAGLTRGAVQQGNAETIRVTGKGDKRRIVLLDGGAQRAIRRYLSRRSDRATALFASHPRGKPSRSLDVKGIQRVVERLWQATRARFPENPELQSARISPHIFRHVVGASLTREGANPHTVKTYLGHASIGTTEVYLEDAADERVMDDVRTYTPARRDQIRNARTELDLPEA